MIFNLYNKLRELIENIENNESRRQNMETLAIVDPNAPVVGRIVQKFGTTEDVVWGSNDVVSLAISPETYLPVGMTAEVIDTNVVIHFQPEVLGTFVATFVLNSMSMPNLPDWTGLPIQRQMIGNIVWHVFPEVDAPFMNGLGDVLLPSS